MANVVQIPTSSIFIGVLHQARSVETPYHATCKTLSQTKLKMDTSQGFIQLSPECQAEYRQIVADPSKSLRTPWRLQTLSCISSSKNRQNSSTHVLLQRQGETIGSSYDSPALVDQSQFVDWALFSQAQFKSIKNVVI